MKIYVYTIQHDLIHFNKRTFIADNDKQANEYSAHLRERLLATGEAEVISGPFELNSTNLILGLVFFLIAYSITYKTLKIVLFSV